MIVVCYSQVIDAEQTPPPGKFSVADLQKLKWIEGTWRGTGDVESPFFERYRFENETTLAVDSFTDGTLTKVEDTTRFALKDGQFGNDGEGSRWVATTIDYLGVTFVPFVKARNTFRWQHVASNVGPARLYCGERRQPRHTCSSWTRLAEDHLPKDGNR